MLPAVVKFFRNKNVQRLVLWVVPFVISWLFSRLDNKKPRR
jgi:hypothetical protein